MWEFIQSNLVLVLGILLGLSELLSLTPFVKANGILQLVFGWIITWLKSKVTTQ